MRKILIGLFFIAVSIMTSCSSIAPFMVTQNTVGAKQGKARAVFLFGSIALDGGDYSVGTAARNGGISKIAVVDIQTQNYLGIVIVKQAIVSGE